mmetsp:Transcript_14204/g.36124  ORF Transcript_14204/g.36124 Transcript_14204/m.36124 type:complete len:102 (-) Transcript_14204:205-510(-)
MSADELRALVGQLRAENARLKAAVEAPSAKRARGREAPPTTAAATASAAAAAARGLKAAARGLEAAAEVLSAERGRHEAATPPPPGRQLKRLRRSSDACAP